MKSKATPYIFLAVLLVIALVITRLRNKSGDATASHANRTQSKGNDAASGVNRNRGFDRRTSFLEYTRHARCRMECREVREAEVQDIMKNGTINYRKSNAKGKPCPTYAVEGYSSDKQHLRIVFAQCDQSTKVVTCIDLDKEWECHCPGDDDKYNNQQR